MLLLGLLAFLSGLGIFFTGIGGYERQIGAGFILLGLLGCVLFLLLRTSKGSGTRITAAERTYRAFFDHALEGIFRSTPEGRYLDANPALARIYGFKDPEELMIRLTDIGGQLYIDPKRREDFGRLMLTHDSVKDFVSQICRHDGKVIWISENARAVRDWTGKLVFYEGTVEDVTPKIEAQNALRRALQESEDANRAQSAFLAAMSHELKTPLNAVLGFSELLKDEILGPIGNPSYRGYAQDIHDSGSRLLAIINDLLDVARLEGGALTLDSQETPLSIIIDEAVHSAKQNIDERCHIHVELQPNIPFLNVDPRRLTQALANLLSNALKFTPDHGNVTVTAHLVLNGALRISVVDTGIGMSPEKIAGALQPFQQIDNTLSRRYEGAGLGLPISKALVELHGGRLVVESAEGCGTSVHVDLPAYRLKSPPQPPRLAAAG